MQVWCDCQVTLCDPHLNTLEVRFSRRCAIQIDVYLYLYLSSSIFSAPTDVPPLSYPTNDHISCSMLCNYKNHKPSSFARLFMTRCTACCQRDIDAFPNSDDLTARFSCCGDVAGRISLNRKQQRSITVAQTSLYDRLES